MRRLFVVYLIIIVSLSNGLVIAEENKANNVMRIYDIDFYSNNNNEQIINDILYNKSLESLLTTNKNYWEFVKTGEDSASCQEYVDDKSSYPVSYINNEPKFVPGVGIINAQEIVQWADVGFIQKVLKENNIDESVQSYLFFNRYRIDRKIDESNYQMSVLIKTSENIYWGKINYSYLNIDSGKNPEYRFDSIKILTSNDLCDNYRLQKGNIIVNGNVYDTDNAALFANGEALIPLRSAVEAIGGTVEWDSKTDNIIITYENQSYLCWCSQYTGGIQMFKGKHENEHKISSEYIVPLHGENANSDAGLFYMINDRTLLTQSTGVSLLNYFNYDVTVDVDNKKLILSKKV